MCCASACMRVRHPVPECTPDDGPVHWRVAVQVASGPGCERRRSGVQTDVPPTPLEPTRRRLQVDKPKFKFRAFF